MDDIAEHLPTQRTYYDMEDVEPTYSQYVAPPTPPYFESYGAADAVPDALQLPCADGHFMEEATYALPRVADNVLARFSHGTKQPSQFLQDFLQ